MMFADAGDLYASAASRRMAGLDCGCMHGPTVADYKQIAMDSGAAVLRADGDVKAAFAPALQAAAGLALALPPPWGIVASAVAGASAAAIQAIRNQMGHAVMGAGKYLPVDIAKKTVAEIEKNWLTSWKAAGKDKLVRYITSPDDGAPDSVTFAAKKANDLLPPDERLNLEIATRLANRVYDVAKSHGAKDYQAAAAALYGLRKLLYKDGSTWYKGLGKPTWAYHDALFKNVLKAQAGDTLDTAFDRIGKAQGLVAVTAADVAKKGGSKGDDKPAVRSGGGSALPLLAGGAVALLLLAR